MKILVTGATGMIGSRLVPHLLARGHQLVCLVRRPDQAASMPPLKGAELIQADLTDASSLQGKAAGCDVVIHLAVLGHLNEGAQDECEFQRVNVQGLSNLLDECRTSGPKRIIVTSSSAALGSVDVPIIDESTAAEPSTPYGRSKHAADLLVASYVKEQQLPVLILRFTHVYGPGDKRDFLKIVRWIRKGIFPQVGRGPNYYPALYLDDAVSAIELALTKGSVGETYIVTDSDPHDTREIRRLVREELSLPQRPYPLMPRSVGLWTFSGLEGIFARLGKASPVSARSIRNLSSARRFSIAKAERELGFSPQVDLRSGIQRTIQWYRQEGLL